MISHWLGWIATVIGITELGCYAARKTKSKHLKRFRGKHHMAWGNLALAIGLLHGILTCTISPLGISLWLVMFALYLTYTYRQSLGKYWMQLHRVLAVLFAVLSVLHIFLRGK